MAKFTGQVSDEHGRALRNVFSVALSDLTGEIVSGTADPSDLLLIEDSATHEIFKESIADVLGSSGSSIDHGSLFGLGDDDHALYHTDARALAWLGTRSTTDLPEGTNLYWTTARTDLWLTGKTTTDLAEGTNLYFTNLRARDAVGGILLDTASVNFTYVSDTSIAAAVIPGGVDHNSLLNLTTGDPHTQYLLASGTRALTGNWVAGAFTITAKEFLTSVTTTGSCQSYSDLITITATGADTGTTYRGSYSNWDYTANFAGGAHMPTFVWQQWDMDLVKTASAFMLAPATGIKMTANRGPGISGNLTFLTLTSTAWINDRMVNVDVSGSGYNASDGIAYFGVTDSAPTGPTIAVRSKAQVTSTNSQYSAVGYQGYVQHGDLFGRGTAVALNPIIFSSAECAQGYYLQPSTIASGLSLARVFSVHTGGRGNILASSNSIFATSTARANFCQIGATTFTGAGVNDCYTKGVFTGTVSTAYRVEIDGIGTPDTFKWSDTGGAAWNATGVAITGTDQTLNNGVKVRFATTTLHTLTNRWDFTCAPLFTHLDVTAGGQLYAEGESEFDGKAWFDGNAQLIDNSKILVGTGADLEIYHDGTNSIIKNNTGQLSIDTTDVVFTTSGSGLPYGSCYGGPNLGWGQVAAQNTWYMVSHADINPGQLNLVAHDGAGKLTISRTGRYLITYAASVIDSAGITDIQTSIAVNGSAVDSAIIQRSQDALGGIQRPIAGSTIVTLTASDTVELAIRQISYAPGTAVVVQCLNLTIVQVGG